MAIIYEALCQLGTRIQRDVISRTARLSELSRILLNAEEEGNHPLIERYRSELRNAKTQRNGQRDRLMAHVAHCNDGCVRAKGGDLAFATNDPWAKAPSRSLPDIPGGVVLARMLREGETLQAVSEIYQRSESTIRQRLSHAGFGFDGRPVRRPHRANGDPREREPEWPPPWMADGLCSQTDPDAFYPEKGGSTREAKAVCQGCLVQAECLDYALDNDERFGIWGGLSERERRRIKRQIQAAQNQQHYPSTGEPA